MSQRKGLKSTPQNPATESIAIGIGGTGGFILSCCEVTSRSFISYEICILLKVKRPPLALGAPWRARRPSEGEGERMRLGAAFVVTQPGRVHNLQLLNIYNSQNLLAKGQTNLGPAAPK